MTQIDAIKYIVERLYDIDDIEQDVSNARNALETRTTLQLENMVHNHYYFAGANHVINEIREALGMEKLWLPGEKERFDEQMKLGDMGTRLGYDCPPLDSSEATLADGKAQLMTLGEEADAYLVLGTKSAQKAYNLMRRYERDECGLGSDEGVAALYKDDIEKLPRVKVAWRKAYDEYESDYRHMFTWNDNYTEKNPNAVEGFLVRVG